MMDFADKYVSYTSTTNGRKLLDTVQRTNGATRKFFARILSRKVENFGKRPF